MENQTNQDELSNERPATERVTAPATAPVQWVMPNQKSVERVGSASAPTTHFFPEVRGGICEFCGVMDPNQPSQYQYKLCPHYRGMQLRCTYCPESKDSDDVNYHANLHVAEHPYNKGTLVVWCDSYDCSKKHTDRFKLSA